MTVIQYRTPGRTGVQVSTLSLGFMNVNVAPDEQVDTRPSVADALLRRR